MNQMKIYKITLFFEDGSNCKTVWPGKDAKTALEQFLQAPSARKHQQRHSLMDFKVEELVELPAPPENRFYLENVGDGKYVVIDEQRKQALTFEFGRLFETSHFTNFREEKPPHSEINSDFLMDVHLWLSKYHPTIVGMD